MTSIKETGKMTVCKEINMIFDASKKTYGSPRRYHSQPIAPRVFKIEDELPSGPNQVFAGDITYLRLGPCFLYLAVVMDIFSRKIVGWSITNSLETTGVLNAMKIAFQNCGKTARIIFHSDRGVQYASKVFLELLANKKAIPSMSRKGNCYDNAFVESFFKSLKSEWLYRNDYVNEAKLRALVFEFIETWYNRKRMHSPLGYQSPLEYEVKQLTALKTVHFSWGIPLYSAVSLW